MYKNAGRFSVERNALLKEISADVYDLSTPIISGVFGGSRTKIFGITYFPWVTPVSDDSNTVLYRFNLNWGENPEVHNE